MSRVVFDFIPKSLLSQATTMFIDQFGEVFNELLLSPNDLYIVIYEMLSDKKIFYYNEEEELISYLIPTFGDKVFNLRDSHSIEKVEEFFKNTFSVKQVDNAHIRYFITKDGYKSRGIGTEILKTLEDVAVIGKKTNITLSVLKNNTGVVEFYKKRGYIINGEFYYNNDFYTMIKYI